MRVEPLVKILAVLSVLLGCCTAAAQPGWEVHYQTTYSDGTVRDLNEIPRTKKDIRRVVRISRREDAHIGYKMLSTGPHALTVVRGGHTVKNELKWNGAAWVGRQQAIPASVPAVPRPREPQSVLEQERRRVRRILSELQTRLVRQDHEVAEAERALARDAGSPGQEQRVKRLVAARTARDGTLKAIELYEVQLKAIGDDPAARPPQPSGKVEPPAPTPSKGAKEYLGLDERIEQFGTLPHKQQVWKLPTRHGKRKYCVEMAHPEPGPLGAFHYVAYADTDDDGLPDKLIARSPLATAGAPGEWTRWSFATSEPVVYVGNAWAHGDTALYYAHPPVDYVSQHWNGLSNDVYVSGLFYGIPNWRSPYGPYLSNIRVHVSNPFGPTHSPVSKIIIK